MMSTTGRPPERPPAESPATADLLSQARRVRQGRSTADIILQTQDQASGVTGRTIGYIIAAAAALAILLLLFLSPATRATMEERTQALAELAAPEETVLEAGEANERPAPAGAGPIQVRTELADDPRPRPTEPAPSRPLVTAVAEPAARSQPAARPPAGAVPAMAAGSPEARAYEFLIRSRPAFAQLMDSGGEMRYQSHQAVSQGDGSVRFDFTFQRGPEAVHVIWEVNPAAEQIRPIGLQAVRLDRQRG